MSRDVEPLQRAEEFPTRGYDAWRFVIEEGLKRC